MDDKEVFAPDAGVTLVPTAVEEAQPAPPGPVETTLDTPKGLTLEDGVAYHNARLTGSASLSDLAGDYVFFTHAALFCYAHWDRDPVVNHILDVKGACEPFFIHLPRPVFKFLDLKNPAGQVVDDSWNRTLVGVHKTQWEPLFKFLHQVQAFCRERKYFHLCEWQKLSIPDVVWLDKMNVLPESGAPTVDCYCLAVGSNKNVVYFAAQHRKQRWDPIPVSLAPAKPHVVRYARALFKPGVMQPTPRTSVLDSSPEESRDDVIRRVLKGRELRKLDEVTPDERLAMPAPTDPGYADAVEKLLAEAASGS